MPRLGERGAALNPRSQELHHILGTISDVVDISKPVPCVRAHDLLDNQKSPQITRLFPFVEPQFHTPYVRK